MKKINIERYLGKFSREISLAKANNYEALIVPFDDCDVIPFNNINDEDYIYEIAYDCGWEMFIVIDFINDTKQLFDLSLDAA